MNIVYILIAILILGFIIMVHELGHYTVGRLCGLGIEEFSIGFGPKLVQWGKGIKYTLRALPIGGYVRFAGEDADSEDPRAFNNAPVWKRFLTTLAGLVEEVHHLRRGRVHELRAGVPGDAGHSAVHGRGLLHAAGGQCDRGSACPGVRAAGGRQDHLGGRDTGALHIRGLSADERAA